MGLREMVHVLPFVAAFGCADTAGATTRDWARYTVELSVQTRVALGRPALGKVNFTTWTPDDDFYDSDTVVYTPVTLRIEETTCAPECTVIMKGETDFEVTATSAGSKELVVRYSTSDGNDGRATARIDFELPTEILARRRGGGSTSGSVFAMVPGTTQTWTPAAANAKGDLEVDPCPFEVEASGALTLEPRAGCDALFTIRATKGGTGTVTMRLGQLVHTETVTVIDPSTIATVELRHAPKTGSMRVSQKPELPAEPQPLVVRYRCTEPERLIAIATTKDGTLALGGTIVPHDPATFTAQTDDQTANITVKAPSDGNLRVVIGERTFDPLPYLVRAGCPTGEEAGSGGERDAGEGNGG